MNSLRRVVLFVWPLMIGAMLIGAWLRLNSDVQGSLIDQTIPVFAPFGALLIFLYLLRGGVWVRHSPQSIFLSIVVAMLTVPVVVAGSFILATVLLGA